MATNVAKLFRFVMNRNSLFRKMNVEQEKRFRVIQNVLIAVGIITTVSLVDGIEVSASNVQAAFVIACFTIVTILEREFRSEKDEE